MSRAERKRDKERDGMGGKERADFVGEDQRERERVGVRGFKE